MKWPPLPRTVMGAGGPITVRLIKRVKGDAGEDCYGTWEPSTRTIRIERSCRPAHRWRIYWHEWCHSAIDDAGLCHLLTPDAQETLADCIATSRMAELRAGLLP
jgi:hypothetical protein